MYVGGIAFLKSVALTSGDLWTGYTCRISDLSYCGETWSHWHIWHLTFFFFCAWCRSNALFLEYGTLDYCGTWSHFQRLWNVIHSGTSSHAQITKSMGVTHCVFHWVQIYDTAAKRCMGQGKNVEGGLVAVVLGWGAVIREWRGFTWAGISLLEGPPSLMLSVDQDCGLKCLVLVGANHLLALVI